MDSHELGRFLLIIAGVIAVIGLVLLFAGRIPFFGQLPGDIIIERENSRIFIPLVSMLVVSVVLTIVLNLVIRLFR